MKVLSLFDGMSCGQIALNRLGVKYEKYFASEVDKYAIQITQKNYQQTIQLGDVTKWHEWDLPKIDLLIGGSPCQGFSFAGKQLNFSDPRSKLFFEFVEILKYHKPKYFLLENVKMKKEYQAVITNILGVEPIEINSALVSAQNRKRLYWTNIPGITQPEDKGVYLRDIVQDDTEIENKYFLSQAAKERLEAINIRAKNKGLGYKDCILDVYGENKKFLNLDASFYKGPDGKRGVLLTKDLRNPTPIECERLQTVPDNYTEGVSNTQRYKMLGNGWTVDVIAHIFSFI